MAEGAGKDRWAYVAHLLCTIYNHTRGKGDTFVKFEDVYPYFKKPKRAARGGGWDDVANLRDSFKQMAKKRADGGAK